MNGSSVYTKYIITIKSENESKRQGAASKKNTHRIDGNDTETHSVLAAVDHSLHANNMSLATLEQH